MPAPKFRGNFYAGLFQNVNETIQPVSPVCSVGTCTWPPYYTLGLYTEVTDISNRLTSNCINGSTKCYICNPFGNDLPKCNFSLALPAKTFRLDDSLACDDPSNYTRTERWDPTDLITIMVLYSDFLLTPPFPQEEEVGWKCRDLPIANITLMTMDLNANLTTDEIYQRPTFVSIQLKVGVFEINTTVANGKHTSTFSRITADITHRNISTEWGEFQFTPEGKHDHLSIPEFTITTIVNWIPKIFDGAVYVTKGLLYGVGPGVRLYTSEMVQALTTALKPHPRIAYKEVLLNMFNNVAMSVTNA